MKIFFSLEKSADQNEVNPVGADDLKDPMTYTIVKYFSEIRLLRLAVMTEYSKNK